MDTEDKNNYTYEILKNAYQGITPSDSWQALRARIDRKIDSKSLVSSPEMRNIAFWRRLSFGMAACFLITLGILIYFLGAHYGVQEYQQQHISAANNLLSQADLNRLSFAFSQVQQLFGQQSQWVMIGSGNSTEMGVADMMISGADSSKVVVVRLAVNLENEQGQQQYFDIVALSNQQARFQLPIVGASAIDVRLRPTLRNDGRIEIEIDAQADSTSRANSVSTVVDDEFTSLLRMRANGTWVNIDGVGKSISKI
jgi:hypothetical protein